MTRGFCGSCGSGITYRNERRIEELDVALATLDDPGPLRPEYHIWVSQKLPWVEPGDQLPVFDEWRMGDP